MRGFVVYFILGMVTLLRLFGTRHCVMDESLEWLRA